jgi:myosin heavy subunit
MELIQDDPKLFDIRNKWFYTSQDSPTCPPIIIPLQHANGVPAVAPPQPTEQKASNSAIDSLAESLTRLAGVVESNAEQVHALSVAQSAGLQAMQEINESSGTQIRAISDSQLKLQALVDQNASHYIALSNTSFQSQEQTRQSQEATRKTQEQTQKSQEQTREILKTTVSQLQTLSKNHLQLAQNCEGMMRRIESLNSSVNQMAMSDTASTHSCSANSSNALVPAPRKLNRRVRGIWYEYDHLPEQQAHTTTTRRRVDSTPVTPPKSPVVFKNV